MQRQVRFNRVPEKVPEKVPRGFGAEAGQVQQGSGEGSGEGSARHWCRGGSGSTGFRRRFPRRSGRLWCRARSRSTGSGERRRFREALAEPGQVQQGSGEGSEGSGEGLGGFGASQVRFNRFNRVPKFPEKVLEKLLGSIGEKPSQVQRVPGEGFGNLWCRARSGSNRFNRVSSAWLRGTLQKDQHASERFVRRKRCGCWGYHRSLFFLG